MNLLEKAIEHFGEESQMNMVQEECSELIQAISKYRRAADIKDLRNSRENILEEVADVEIMLDQLKIIVNATESELFYYRQYKLNRLQKRIGV